MEDAATAEISRAQLWQWTRHGVTSDDGKPVTLERYRSTREEELAKLGGPSAGRLGDAAAILDQLVESDEFVTFLTLPAYGHLD
jgi:malate synthase